MENIISSMVLFLVFRHVDAQQVPNDEPEVDTFHQYSSLTVTVGVVAIILVLILIILAYTKFSHTPNFDLFSFYTNHDQNRFGLVRTGSRFSGFDKNVIESLPFFIFSSLKGLKQGLECVVCLSKFDDAEMLRLLPKCKHAFHMNCIDIWLEKHSSCPLCRHKLDPSDATSFAYSSSLRLTDDPNLEISVQRSELGLNGSSRFSSFRRIIDNNYNKDHEKVQNQECSASTIHNVLDSNESPWDKFDHKIILSNLTLKNRWSDVNSSDMLLLNSQMIECATSQRFSKTGNEGLNLCSFDETRSKSEITNVSRFREYSTRTCCNRNEDSARRLFWLSTVRKTVKWSMDREKQYSSNV